MNQLPPGLRGFLAQRQMAGQEQNQQLGQMQGILGIQQAMTQRDQMAKDQEFKGLLGARLAAGDMEGAKTIAMQYKPELFAQSLVPKPQEPFTLTPGSIRFGPDGKQIAAAPVANRPQQPSDLARLISERDAIPQGDPRRATYDNAIRKASEVAGQIVPRISVNTGPSAYFTPIPTANGMMAFNNRTGRMEPVTNGGAPVIPATADPALQGNLAAARAGGTVTGREGAESQMALPTVITRAENGIRLIDEMIGSADGKVKPHPGFNSYVGATLMPGARFIEGTPAADFQSRENQVKGQSFLEAFEQLKGGGQITEIEGRKATEAINRMNKSQSEREYTAAAREVQNILRKGVENARKRAAYNGPDRRAPSSPQTLRFDAQGNLIQ